MKSLSEKINKLKSTSAGCEVDLTPEMLNFFVRLEIQRRYFNIVTVEMLSNAFGMKGKKSMDELLDRDTRINLDRLIKNGRNITVD